MGDPRSAPGTENQKVNGLRQMPKHGPWVALFGTRPNNALAIDGLIACTSDGAIQGPGGIGPDQIDGKSGELQRGIRR